MKRLLTTSLILLGCLNFSANAAHHKGAAWSLSADESKVAYGSIKKNAVGEVNHFTSIDGTVSKAGKVKVSIDVTSVETFIGIRNERMLKHVFDAAAPKATLTADIDLQAVEGLANGATTQVDVEGVLTLSGKEVPVETTFFVARLGENRFLASTDEMIMVKTEDLGINAGVDKLMELAKLDSITRVVPVSLRLVFDREGAKAAAGKKAEAPAKSKVNIAAGKKVYKQCAACHNAKKEQNGVGPHMLNVVGRTAGSVGGFAYSDAIKGSGIVWDEKNLTAFLQKPQQLIPGNRMPFAGMTNTDDIKNLIAYLDTLK